MSAESKTRMTEGSISRKIILFAIPLFLGNLFQQLYNTADSLIVGNFLGSNALAAVSSSGNLIFLMVGFINGIAMGAGVVIARYYGAKNREDLQKVIHTTVAFGLAAGLALTAIGMYLAPKILVLMGTPDDVMESIDQSSLTIKTAKLLKDYGHQVSVIITELITSLTLSYLQDVKQTVTIILLQQKILPARGVIRLL